MSAPLCEIAANAGMEGTLVLDKVNTWHGIVGFMAATCEYGDMIAFNTRRRTDR